MANQNCTIQLLCTLTILTRNNIYFMWSRLRMNKLKVKNIKKLFFQLYKHLNHASLKKSTNLCWKVSKFSFFTFICLKIRHVPFVILKRMTVNIKENWQTQDQIKELVMWKFWNEFTCCLHASMHTSASNGQLLFWSTTLHAQVELRERLNRN